MAQICKRKGQKCWNSQTKRKHWSIVSHAAKSRPLSVCFFFTSCAPYRQKKIWQKLWFMSWNFLGRSLTSTLPAALTYCLTCDLARFIWHICQHLIWHTSCDIHMYIAYILKCDGANFTWHLVWFVLWQKRCGKFHVHILTCILTTYVDTRSDVCSAKIHVACSLTLVLRFPLASCMYTPFPKVFWHVYNLTFVFAKNSWPIQTPGFLWDIYPSPENHTKQTAVLWGSCTLRLKLQGHISCNGICGRVIQALKWHNREDTPLVTLRHGPFPTISEAV